MSRKPAVLFVGDLSSVCTQGHIRELFEVNGFTVIEIKMMGGKVSSNSFDYGFVQLASIEEADAALTSLDGTFLCGRRLRVKWAAPNIKNKSSKGVINSVHVRFQSLQPGLSVNEEILLSVFEVFGTICDASVKSCSINPSNGLQDGYGFVHFPCSPEGVAAAMKAVSALGEEPVVNHVHYSCEMSKNLLKLLQIHSQRRTPDMYSMKSSHGHGHSHGLGLPHPPAPNHYSRGGYQPEYQSEYQPEYQPEYLSGPDYLSEYHPHQPLPHHSHLQQHQHQHQHQQQQQSMMHPSVHQRPTRHRNPVPVTGYHHSDPGYYPEQPKHVDVHQLQSMSGLQQRPYVISETPQYAGTASPQYPPWAASSGPVSASDLRISHPTERPRVQHFTQAPSQYSVPRASSAHASSLASPTLSSIPNPAPGPAPSIRFAPRGQAQSHQLQAGAYHSNIYGSALSSQSHLGLSGSSRLASVDGFSMEDYDHTSPSSLLSFETNVDDITKPVDELSELFSHHSIGGSRPQPGFI